MPFDVRVVEPMGSHLLLTGSIDGQLARIVAPPTAKVNAGERVGLTVDPVPPDLDRRRHRPRHRPALR